MSTERRRSSVGSRSSEASSLVKAGKPGRASSSGSGHSVSAAVAGHAARGKDGKKKKDQGFEVKQLEPHRVHKGGDRIVFANGDVFEGPLQAGAGVMESFFPNGQGTYTVALSGCKYSGKFTAGKMTGDGSLEMRNGNKISGKWADGHCQGTLKYLSGDIYTGSTIRGIRQGYGVCEYKSSSRYEGEWEADLRHGSGTLRYDNADWLEGNWKENSFIQGRGRITTKGGDSYEGKVLATPTHPAPRFAERPQPNPHQELDLEFSRDGQGVCDFANGDHFEGDWLNDLPHGSGKMNYKDGTWFEGTWSKGLPQRGKGKLQRNGWTFEGGIAKTFRDGAGHCIWDSGMKYEGDWVADMRHGKGTCVYDTEGTKYEGEWQDDLRNGKGNMMWAEGSVYAGDFFHDYPHGRGRARYTNGQEFEGDFDVRIEQDKDKPGGVPCGRGRLAFPWGDVYTGNVMDGRPHGQGRLFCDNGDEIEGEFVEGVSVGHMQGHRAYPDGSHYHGSMLGWMPDGVGSLKFTNGLVYSGLFRDGEPCGLGSVTDPSGATVFEGEFKDGQPSRPVPGWKFPP